MGIIKLITKNIDSIKHNAKLQEILDQMIKNNTKYIVLIKDQTAIGIITLKTILSLYSKQIKTSEKAIKYANKNLITCFEDEKYNTAFKIVCDNKIDTLIVQKKDNTYLGCINKVDLIHHINRNDIIQKKLKFSNIVFENSTEGIMITNKDNKIISINKAFNNITGYAFEEIEGLDPKVLQSGKHNQIFYSKLWEDIKKNGFWKGEIWNRKKNGEIYQEWLNISEVKDEQGNITNYISLFSDITKIKDSKSKIEYLSHHDALTDLPNRLLLNARLNKSIEKANEECQSLAVLFLDIDNFKIINDSYGHTIGDKIIKLVSKRLQKNIRKNDTIARIGGDEFIIVIEDIQEQKNVQKIVNKILKDFIEPIKLQEYLFDTTISIGVSLFPQHGLNYEDLIKHADTAMYCAKDSGKNQVQFYKDEMTSDIFKKIMIKQEIKDALQNNEFEVYFQPQIDIKTKKLIGAEALVRWNHQYLGLIPPDQFIPSAEETKLIIPLGEYVLEKSIKFMKKLHDLNILKDGVIAINVSGEQIKHSNIIETIIKSLKQNQLEPKFVEIEVTETFIMQDVNKSIKLFKEIKDIGLKLAIDDFGTGYSSLNYLKQFPIDKLKIDKSFIDELPFNQKDIAIAKTIIALAKGLNLKTIAEGVENNKQADFLKKEGCDEIQGWLYSKALNENAFINFCKEHK